MDISIFLAQFWGWYFILFFILFMIYPKRIKQMFVFAKDDKFMIILSILGIIIGLLHILAHNLWVKDWRIIITLFGWFSLSKGISQFAFPGFANKWIENIDFKLLAQVNSYELNTERETVDTTTLSDEFRSRISTLMSGSGRMSCFWEYRGDTVNELPQYLVQLALRTKVGSQFKARFYLKTIGYNPSGEAAAANDFENNVATLNILELLNVDSLKNNDLDALVEKFTLQDIGDIFKVTRMRICQIEKIAIKKLKDKEYPNWRRVLTHTCDDIFKDNAALLAAIHSIRNA